MHYFIEQEYPSFVLTAVHSQGFEQEMLWFCHIDGNSFHLLDIRGFQGILDYRADVCRKNLNRSVLYHHSTSLDFSKLSELLKQA